MSRLLIALLFISAWTLSCESQRTPEMAALSHLKDNPNHDFCKEKGVYNLIRNIEAPLVLSLSNVLTSLVQTYPSKDYLIVLSGANSNVFSMIAKARGMLDKNIVVMPHSGFGEQIEDALATEATIDEKENLADEELEETLNQEGEELERPEPISKPQGLQVLDKYYYSFLGKAKHKKLVFVRFMVDAQVVAHFLRPLVKLESNRRIAGSLNIHTFYSDKSLKDPYMKKLLESFDEVNSRRVLDKLNFNKSPLSDKLNEIAWKRFPTQNALVGIYQPIDFKNIDMQILVRSLNGDEEPPVDLKIQGSKCGYILEGHLRNILRI